MKQIFNKYFTLLLFILASLTLNAQQIDESYKLVKIDLRSVSLNELGHMGLEVDHGIHAPGRFWMHYLSAEERALLDKASISYELPDPSGLKSMGSRSDICPSKSDLIRDPKNFRLGAMAGYFTPKEMEDILDSMNLLYPNLISKRKNIGTFRTVEDRPIQWVRISNKPESDQNKPRVLFTALHHAREPMSLSQLIYYMWYLLENYDTNQEIRNLIDQSEIYFIPCVNPDGYAFNASNKPAGGGMWRKNRKPHPSGFIGVDLNRNYGFAWGFDDSGSSPEPLTEIFRGTAAFSEAETQAVAFLADQYRFSLVLNYHTYGNYLIHPWNYVNELCPDDAIFKNIAHTYAQQNSFAIGTSQETVGYRANGVSDDWLYAHDPAHKVFSMTPEVGLETDGFWPAASKIKDLAKTTLRGNVLYAMMAHRYFETVILDPLYVINNQANTFNVVVNRIGVEEGPVQWVLKVISNNASLGQSNFIMDLEVAEQVQNQFVITPDPGLQAGDIIKIEFSKQMGAISTKDTLSFEVKGSSTFNINPCDDFSTVTLDGVGWGPDTEEFYSAPASFSDSPGENYKVDQTNGIVFNDEYTIPTTGKTILSYWVKWDIEGNFDYAQVYAITDAGEVPLCGKFTKPGTVFQDEDQPVYDGNSILWLKEEIPMDDFAGQSIYIGVRLVSDELETRKGINIDDVKMETFNETAASRNIRAKAVASIYPNPASQFLNISVWNTAGPGSIHIKNTLGNDVLAMKTADLNKVSMDISSLPAGIYFAEIKSDSGDPVTKKWVKY